MLTRGAPKERWLLGVMFLVCAVLPWSCKLEWLPGCDGEGWHYNVVSVERDGVEVPKTSTKWGDGVILQSSGCTEKNYLPYDVSGRFWLEQ